MWCVDGQTRLLGVVWDSIVTVRTVKYLWHLCPLCDMRYAIGFAAWNVIWKVTRQVFSNISHEESIFYRCETVICAMRCELKQFMQYAQSGLKESLPMQSCIRRWKTKQTVIKVWWNDSVWERIVEETFILKRVHSEVNDYVNKVENDDYTNRRETMQV